MIENCRPFFIFVKKFKMQFIIIFILILAVLLVIFTLQNSLVITIHVFFWKIDNAPLVLVLLACIIIGYIVAVIYFYPRLWKVRKEYKHLKKINEELDKSNDLNHIKNRDEGDETDPEGIELDDDENDDTFFKD